MILFSGAQLHETVPNTTGLARYSIDFRTVNFDDASPHRGAPTSIRVAPARPCATICALPICSIFRKKSFDPTTTGRPPMTRSFILAIVSRATEQLVPLPFSGPASLGRSRRSRRSVGKPAVRG